MTRDEAKKRFWADGKKTHNHNEIIDIVFDDFENRTCESCKHCSKVFDNGDIRCDLFECYQQKALKYCGNWEQK